MKTQRNKKTIRYADAPAFPGMEHLVPKGDLTLHGTIKAPAKRPVEKEPALKIEFIDPRRQSIERNRIYAGLPLRKKRPSRTVAQREWDRRVREDAAKYERAMATKAAERAQEAYIKALAGGNN